MSSSSGLAITGFDSGNVVALDYKTGKLAWEMTIAQARGRTDLERMVDIDGEPLVVDDTLYVATFQGRIAAVSLSTGQGRWDKDLSSHAGMDADARYVYVTDENSYVWALDRDSGRAAWKQDKLRGRAVSAPASIGEYVVVGDFEGYLHWLRRDDGKFVARTQVDDSRIIAPPFQSGGVLYAYSSSGILSAFRPK
jgi:outer membrane protein assembly factor BamB